MKEGESIRGRSEATSRYLSLPFQIPSSKYFSNILHEHFKNIAVKRIICFAQTVTFNSSITIVLVCVLPDFRSSSILSPFASTLHCISFNSSAALNEGRFALFDLYFTSVMRHCSLVSHLSPVFCQQTFNGQMCSICYVSAIMNVDQSSKCNIGFLLYIASSTSTR